MKRRFFLQSLLATAVLDPERLLWVPGKKTIFIPPAPTEGLNLAFLRSFDPQPGRWIITARSSDLQAWEWVWPTNVS